MNDLGVAPYLIGSTLIGVLAQRLVAKALHRLQSARRRDDAGNARRRDQTLAHERQRAALQAGRLS